MASLCKRQQCTIDRRGFRQELDSWRHKLIHCVGFESIIEGLFGPELVQDLQLFKDHDPLAVSDWSFDENCVFCCLRRNKVKEHLSSLNSDGLEDPPKPLLVKDQTLLIKIERQAEEFLSAVFRRKDVPNFSDPHVPVVAREILQGMIRQFAAEYTSKSSPQPQEPSASQPHSDQSLPCAQPLSPSLSSSHNLNPVLSKLLMIDQDAPLDLTVKKPPAEPTEQDGVLDLSIKKNRNSSCLSPVTSTPKGRSLRADGLLMRSRQDGRRENIGHSARSKSSPSISYSLHIKGEVASESDPDRFRPNGSPSWKPKTNGNHFKLKNNVMNEHLKDIPKLLELAGLISKSLAENPNENGSDHQLSLCNSAFDLKIPQVRTSTGASDQSWDSLSSEYSGLRCEKKLLSILPHKRHINGLNGSTVEKEHWPYNGERVNSVLDPDADLGMKQPRKKRGRYRQYNTELLEEAIVVVMGGKMSVSKAQSIYGIPHSTLEYKVKERLGTLKNPPKKKLRLMSQAEEQDEAWLCRGKESPDSQNRESASLSLQEFVADLLIDYHIHKTSMAEKPIYQEPREVQISKVKDLQAAPTLEQFISKLCLHHQRQIICAIVFIEREVKALTPHKSTQPVTSARKLQKTSYSPVASPLPTTRPSPEPSKSDCNPDVRPNTKPKLSVTPAPPPAASRISPSPTHTSPTPTTTPTLETKNGGHGDHAPLKLKIMKTGSVAAGNKLSCVLTAALSPQPGDDKPGNASSAETHRARLNSSFKKHNESSHSHPVRQAVGHAEGKRAKPFSFHVSIPSDSPRTARKSARPCAERRNNDFNDRVILDPDLGHCDIVYINKPITECFKKRHRGMTPRRNARKSTRGLMYADEIWELKTVRTLAGRRNCPNPLLEFNASVTPKQKLSKPKGVPPVDMPCAGECTEATNQQVSTQEPTENESSESGQAKETTTSNVDVLVETSQTDQSPVVVEKVCPSPAEKVDNMDESVKQDISAELEKPSENKSITPQVSIKELSQNTEKSSVEHVLPVSDSVEDSDVEQDNEQGSLDNIEVLKGNPLPEKQVLSKECEKGKISDQPNPESQTKTATTEKCMETEKGNTDVQPAEQLATEQETKVEENNTSVCGKDGKESEAFSETAEEPVKELRPWRRRKSSITSASKSMEKTEDVIVGFVSGKPISASDRSLRRRSGQTVPPKELPKQNKRGRKVQNKTDGDSKTESGDLAKPPPVDQDSKEAKTDSCPSVPPVTEQPTDKPSPKPKMSANLSKVDKKKAIGQSTTPARHLRSSGQSVVDSPTIPPTAVTTTTTSASAVTNQALATECKESSTPAASTPPPTPPPTSEQTSPQTTATSVPSETGKESKIDEHISEPTNGQPQNKEGGPVQSKPKLRSAKVVPDNCMGEKEDKGQVSTEEMTIKSEPQSQPMSLRSKRTLQNEAEPSKSSTQPKPNVEAQVESSSSADSSGPVAKKPKRMPLRSEGHKIDESPPAEEKRSSLRSQRQTSAVITQSELSSPIRMTRTLLRPTAISQSAPSGIVLSSRSDPPRPPSVKFLEALNGAQNQQKISNLNLKFDKMHKGWMQLDREGQPTPKHRNKADRQAAIWKSKRRARKPKTLESSRYSPVQMLFMKGFDLSTICRWFLETTETKSLVIVKKVNTRLPSETQLCFHSSSASGSAQGIYPSLQAERLKKHLKKFAIASPVKSNPKTQKLIAKAFEQELVSVVKGKDKEVTSACVRNVASSAKHEPQKPKSGKTQNPASARILRKYSNIREKQANARLKEKAKVKASLKSFTKRASKSNLKSLKSASVLVKKPKDMSSKSDQKKALVEKSNEQKATKSPTKDKAVKCVKAVKTPKAPGGKQVAKDEVKELPKRASQRLGLPPVLEPNVIAVPKDKTEKKVEEKKAVETSKPTKNKAVKAPEGAENKRTDNPQTNNEGKVSNSPDQVQTRSQRRVDAAGSVNTTPKSVTKKSGRVNKKAAPAEKPALTRSEALKLSAKRSPTAVSSRSASRKAQELLETPAKRTRTK
ncbi:uncharacterized protein [Eucyclogobius newberryi]|uniref:uncharacterized protein n=1 Tax=Eucyclogobius newberryi TaxID=166745 RepID=UPI003B59E582